MQLTTEVKTHAVVFFDKNYVLVTQNQADYIIQDSCKGSQGIKLDGNFYKYSDIRRVVDVEEFYRQNPEHRTEQTRNVFEEHYGDTREYAPIERTAEQEKMQFRGILKGLKSFIDKELAKGNNPLNAIKLYEDKLNKYKKVFA